MKKLMTIIGLLSLVSTLVSTAAFADGSNNKTIEQIKSEQRSEALQNIKSKLTSGEELQFFSNLHEWQVQGSNGTESLSTSVTGFSDNNFGTTIQMLTTLCKLTSITPARRDGNTFFACYAK